ncbi:diguanylate cyclase [Methyloversatilis discipulorum]|uniref:diguanylate cyclase n=1 Tax=Methyloversatilis discipulorum TaxID=1119528 RepID=UPI000380BFD8|nr:diguanylate cyclase [Methyloversatilis discipulorum]
MSSLLQSSLRRRGVIWIFCLLVIAGNSAWVLQSMDTLVEAKTPVEHVQNRLRTSRVLLETLLEAESSLRGYLLTGDRRFLQPYHSALTTLQRVRGEVSRLMLEDPAHARRVPELDQAIDDKLAELDEKATLFSQGDRDAALMRVAEGHGRERMERVRRLMDDYRTAEQAILDVHFGRQAEAIRHAYLTFTISTAISVLLVVLVAWLIRNSARSSAQAEAELQSRNHALAEALDSTARQSTHSNALSELGRFLQSSRDMDEAMALLDHYLPQVFAIPAGALYLTAASRNQLRLACQWGDIPNDEFFEPGDCWGLRRGQPYTQPESAAPTRCTHLHRPENAGSRCLPITAHGEVIGLISLHGRGHEHALSEEQLAQTLEQVALSIGNLQLRETLRQQSVRDALTGLSNRRYLEESLARECARAQRKNLPVAVFMVDVDHFKQFNDRHGHEAGDAVLRTVGRLLRDHARDSDIAARYGGEEFTLVLPEADRDTALARAETLRTAIENLELSFHGNALGTLTISIGIALYPRHGHSPTDLMRAADQALYVAKRNGRNRVHLAESGNPAIAA